MRKSKKAYAISLLLGAFLALVGCGAKQAQNSSTTQNAPVAVHGFEVAETMQVEAGSYVSITYPIVLDEFGNVLDVYCEVTDINGNYVPLTTGKFIATAGTGYTITYVVYTSDKVVHKKNTFVQVQNSLDLYVDGQFVYDVGERVEIEPICIWDDAEYTISYIYGENQPQTVEDNQILLDSVGVYTISIQAKKDNQVLSCSYEVVAQAPITEGEIETIHENWGTVRELSNYGTHGWKAVSTENLYSKKGAPITNRFGEQDYLLSQKVASAQTYSEIWINARSSLQELQALADEGYKYVSVWVYLDAEYEHSVRRITDKERSYYSTLTNKAKPNEWVEFRIELDNTTSRDFLGTYNFFKQQFVQFLEIDNSVKENMTVYIDDIYAVKEIEIELVQNPVTEYLVDGNSVDISTLFVQPNDGEYKYSLSYRGETFHAPKEYAFTKNGEYILKALTNKPNESGLQSIKLTVNDLVGYSGNTFNLLPYNQGEDSKQVDSQSLGSLTYQNQALVAKGYTITEKGEYLCNGGTFTAKTNAYYEIEIVAEYTINNLPCVSYKNVTVDFYCAEKGYEWNSVEDMSLGEYNSFIDRAGTGDDNKWYDITKTTVTGRTGTYLQFSPKDSYPARYKNGFAVMPKHSKAYYQNLQGKNYVLKFDYMFEFMDENTEWKYACYNGTTNGFSEIVYADTWYTVELDLQTVVENWKYITGRIAEDQRLVSLLSLHNGSLPYTVYLGNIRIEQKVANLADLTTKLIDTKNSTSFDVYNYISAEHKAQLQKYSNPISFELVDSNGNTVTLTGSTVLKSQIQNRVYTLYGYIDGTKAYQTELDFYDSTQGIVWNTLDLLNTTSEWRSSQGNAGTSEDNRYYSFSVGEISGKTGRYAKWERNQVNGWSGGYAQGFTLLPLHSKAYYTQYQGQGYTVSFSINYTLVDATNDTFSKYGKDNTGKAYTWAWGDTWYTVSYGLDSLITNYDTITGKGSRDGVSASLFCLTGGNTASNSSYNPLSFNVYMSEMTIAKNA